MGILDIKPVHTPSERKSLINNLVHDIDALDIMLKEGIIESGVQRIGLEQEVCFVDSDFQPAPVNEDVLKLTNDSHFTCEHASYNAEINVDPLGFSGSCLRNMESRLCAQLERLRKMTNKFGADIALVGILPTIGKEHLTPKYFTSVGRYKVINELLSAMRGEPYEFRIEGPDQLITIHDTTMFEGCNTSFQVHLQVQPDDFCRNYNWSQAIAGPVLAASTNSPLLLGKRLWRETRIALFQQSIDARRPSFTLTEKEPRVTFGNQWVRDSVLEIFKDDIARYPMLLYRAKAENAMEQLNRGEIPKLDAITIHNGTVYRWNRPCYGITEGKPHLRIECRYITSGPTVVDEIANMAFWLGLMNGQPLEYRNLKGQMLFADVRSNFIKAARMGLGAQFNWIKHKRIPAKELLLTELLPIAREGLSKACIDQEDIEKYLGVIEERVHTEKTGSQWILDAFNELTKNQNVSMASTMLTSRMIINQKRNIPVHQWDDPVSSFEWKFDKSLKVKQVMTTNLFTINEEYPLRLASSIMAWKKIKHLPVEDRSGKLKGLLTTGILLDVLSRDEIPDTVSDVMLLNPYTVSSDDTIEYAIQIMTENNIGSLPVVQDGYLIGIITERDLIRLARKWL